MQGKELTKKFMIISNLKIPFGFLVYIHIFQRLKGLKTNIITVKAIEHSMYVYDFSCTPVVSICNKRGAFWVQMCPVVHTQWITTLMVKR